MAINIGSSTNIDQRYYYDPCHAVAAWACNTAVGGKGEIEVAALQMGSSLLPTSSEECDQKSFSLKGPLLTIRHVSDG